MNETHNWKKLGPLPGPVYAEMVGEVLKEKDIPYYISNHWFTAAYGTHTTSGVGNHAYIFIPEANYEEVHDIIKGMFDMEV